MTRNTIGSIVLCVVVLAVATTGCTTESYEDQVAKVRAEYTVELDGWRLKDEPLPAEEPVDEAAEAEAIAVAAEAAALAMEEAGEGEVVEEETQEASGESAPRSTDVILDLLVRFSGQEPLPGITVEIVQANASGEEKNTSLHWVDTRGVSNSEGLHIPISLEVDDYEDGDAFSVEWSAFVPPEVRGEYREFSEPGR